MTGSSSTPAVPLAAGQMDLPTAAAYAGVGIPELARAIHQRLLACRVGPGGGLLVDRAALEEWVAMAGRR